MKKNNGFKYKNECVYKYPKHTEKSTGKMQLKYPYEGVILPVLYGKKTV